MFIQPVRFKNSPKLHDMLGEQVYPLNEQVVVQGKRGPEIATVRGEARPQDGGRYGLIVRAATPEDLSQWAQLEAEGEDLKWFLRARARDRKLPVKVVGTDFTLDGNLLTISYSAEQRIELGDLINDVRSRTRARVNLVALGPREQAQMLGALGACGRENCSSTHLQEFAPVSIRMARDQQLPLNPEKLSGPCGRLLCCLQYEHAQYLELLSELPRKNARVCHTETGACGKVVKLNPLRGTVDVASDEGYLEGVSVALLRRDKTERDKPEYSKGERGERPKARDKT